MIWMFECIYFIILYAWNYLYECTLNLLLIVIADGADFIAGWYTTTFTSGATTATASIPIVADDIDEPTA